MTGPPSFRTSTCGSVEPRHTQLPPGERRKIWLMSNLSPSFHGLPLDDFTTARDNRTKQTKAAGDRDLAAQIHRRRKAEPDRLACLWTRARACQEIRPLLGDGSDAAEATATLSGQQLGELSGPQRQLVLRSAASGAHRQANTAKRTVKTLHALREDPARSADRLHAAEALSVGRLTEGMQNSSLVSLAGGNDPERSANLRRLLHDR
jgi:hypothetical protein